MTTLRTDKPARDIYADALRASALLVVVFGHWIATLPRVEDGVMVSTDHLLEVWDEAGILTWLLQVVPLFVFVSAAVSADGTTRRIAEGHRQITWWAGRALSLARPTVTYLGVLAILAAIAVITGGRLLDSLDGSLTVHLWFLLMLLVVQAMLPLSVRADARFGNKAVIGLIVLAVIIEVLRAGPTALSDISTFGKSVVSSAPGIGVLNALVVWLLPQQLGIAWRRGRFGGTWMGLALVVVGAVWLVAAIWSGYPVAMVGGDITGENNILPPTLALIGVMLLQPGLVLLFERPARKLLVGRRLSRFVAILGAIGLPLYLWHKLAELPAAWVGERIGAPIDAGVPGEPGFWAGRLVWILLCLVMVAPLLAGVSAFETRRTKVVPQTTSTALTLIGGAVLFAGLIVAMMWGTRPGSWIAFGGVFFASMLLRARLGTPPREIEPDDPRPHQP